MKKGAYILSGELSLWINRILLTIVVFGSVLFTIDQSLSKDIEIEESIADMAIRRLYYSSSCFASEDLSSDPGVVDIKKFTEKRLVNCLTKKYPIRVRLENKNIQISNLKSFNDELNICKVQNKKEKCLFENEQYVLVKENGNLKQDILKVEVIVK